MAGARAGSGGGGSSGSMALPMAASHRLAGVMRELGYACAASSDAFKPLLTHFAGRIDEATVAEVLGLIAATHRGLDPDALGLAEAMRAALSLDGSSSSSSAGDGGASSWNVAVIMDGIKAAAAPGLSWTRVADALDHDGFLVPDAAGFAALMTAWRRGTSEPFPLQAIAGRVWTHGAGQLSLLVQAVAAPPDVLSWEGSTRKIAPLEGLGAGKSPLGTPNQAWASVDLLATLAQLAEQPTLSAGVLELLRSGPVMTCPEVLIAAAARLRPAGDAAWGVLERFVWGAVAAPLLFDSASQGGGSGRTALLARLWAQHPSALLACMAQHLAERQGCAPQLLDALLELKAVPGALGAAPPALAVELSVLAAGRGLLDLDSWLADRLARDATNGAFMAATLTFLEAQLDGIVNGQLSPAGGSATTPAAGSTPSVLSVESTTALLRGLYSAGAGTVPGLAAALGRALEAAKRAFPPAEAALGAASASPLSPAAADSGLALAAGGAFPEAIELEANGYFQRLYHERQPVGDMVGQLKAFKTGTQHQQVVFACMVHNLFDEYRFFPNYPDPELDTTAALFGALLHHQLLSGITLGMGLRHVLQALAQPPGSKMFRFGVGALAQFKGELHSWPKFCERALAIPHLRTVDAPLCAYMAKVVRAGGGGGSDASAFADIGDAADLTGAASASAGAAPGAAALTPDGGANGVSTKAGAPASSAVAPGGAAATSTTATAAATPAASPLAGGGTPVAGGGAGGAAGAGPGGLLPGGRVGAAASATRSGDTSDNLREMLNNANVAQAAATMALNDKPNQFERMTLNTTLNNETLDSAERKLEGGPVPSDVLSDKVSFLMNNLTQDNMRTKARELGSTVLPGYVHWFGNYLVAKRAAQV